MSEVNHARTFTARWLGRQPYGPVHAMQQSMMRERLEGSIPDTLLLVEHEPVITLGSGAHAENILLDEATLARKGIELHKTGRGGDVTYHGPGQLVAYPIFDLKPDRCDVRRYVSDLRRVMEGLAGDFGVGAGEFPGYPGVWVDTAKPFAAWPGHDTAVRAGKLGAIGVRLSRWITMHGFAFNARPDLTHFANIVPCGIRDFSVVTLESLGVKEIPSVPALAARAVGHVERVFSATCAAREGFPDARTHAA